MRKAPVVFSLLLLAAVAAGAYGLQSSGGWQAASQWLGATSGGEGATPAAGSDVAKTAQGGRQAAPVEVSEAKLRQLSDDVSAIGTLIALETAEIASDTNGRIVSVTAKDGSEVKEGDELFRLDGELVAAEAMDAEARLKLAQSTFDRNQTLAKSRTVAQSVLDQSAAELEVAQAAVELIKVRLARLVVRAPFDGHLGFVTVSEGTYVTAGTPLVRLDKLTTLKVSLSVPERYFAFVSIGQDVTIRSEAVPAQDFTAQVSAINPVVDVNGRALQIFAILDNAELKLRPGMLVVAEIRGKAREAITVSESAVVPQGQSLTVFEVKDDKAYRREVKTGQRRDGWVEITEGLEIGVAVVSAGTTRLADGMAVKVSGQPETQ